jgi:hypothetical protein
MGARQQATPAKRPTAKARKENTEILVSTQAGQVNLTCRLPLVATVSAFCWPWAFGCQTTHDHRKWRGDHGYRCWDIKSGSPWLAGYVFCNKILFSFPIGSGLSSRTTHTAGYQGQHPCLVGSFCKVLLCLLLGFSSRSLGALRVLAVSPFSQWSSYGSPLLTLGEGSQFVAESRPGALASLHRFHLRNSCHLAEL